MASNTNLPFLKPCTEGMEALIGQVFRNPSRHNTLEVKLKIDNNFWLFLYYVSWGSSTVPKSFLSKVKKRWSLENLIVTIIVTSQFPLIFKSIQEEWDLRVLEGFYPFSFFPAENLETARPLYVTYTDAHLTSR